MRSFGPASRRPAAQLRPPVVVLPRDSGKEITVGTNGFGKRGYSICPSGAGEIYMFAIYALPQSLSPPKGFDARELRKEILAVSGNVGLLPAVYSRG